jgi:hypothetical protein
MSRSVIGTEPHWNPLIRLLAADTINDPVRPMYPTANPGQQALLETLIMGPRLTTGGVTLASWPRGSRNPAKEEHHQELTIDEGDLSFFHAHAGWDSEPFNGVTRKVLSSRTIVGSTREFIAAAVSISRGSGIPAIWHIGIGLTGIREYCHQESGWPDYGPPCTSEEYVRVERFGLGGNGTHARQRHR